MIESSKATLIGNGLEFLHELQAVVDLGITDDPVKAATRVTEWLKQRIESMPIDDKAEIILQLQLVVEHCQLLIQTVYIFSICSPAPEHEPWKES